MSEGLKKNRKTVLIMAGGTGGHVFPALAVADELKAQGYDIHWLGTAAGIEADLVPKAGYPMHCIDVTGLRGKGKLALLAAPFKLLKAVWQARKFIKVIQPDAVLGLGGFATGPGGVAAKLSGIPLLIHEQNAFPGMTNRLLKPISTVVMQAFANTFKGTKGLSKLKTTGNPVRSDILSNNEAAESSPNTNDQKLKVLVVGGSLGAVALNTAVLEALLLLPESQRPEVRHQVGKKNFAATQDAYKKAGLAEASSIEVLAFIDDMAAAYQWADLVVCRAGALTVSEVACAGVPAIFIPFPFAVDDHQTANAQVLVNSGAAELKQQADLSAEWLASRWQEYSANRKQLNEMASNALSVAIPDATQVVTGYVVEQIRLKHG